MCIYPPPPPQGGITLFSGFTKRSRKGASAPGYDKHVPGVSCFWCLGFWIVGLSWIVLFFPGCWSVSTLRKVPPRAQTPTKTHQMSRLPPVWRVPGRTGGDPIAPRRPEDAPKTPQDSPKTAPKTAQDGPGLRNTPPRRPKTVSRRPKTAPRRLQDASKTRPRKA